MKAKYELSEEIRPAIAQYVRAIDCVTVWQCGRVVEGAGLWAR
jgi:hypothetical protein